MTKPVVRNLRPMGRVFGDNDELVGELPLPPEDTEKKRRRYARAIWRKKIESVAQALAIKHADVPIDRCIERATELATKLDEIKAPDDLPFNEDEWLL